MTARLRSGLVAGFVSAALLLATAPASAGPTDIELKLAKSESGPFNDRIRRNVPLGEKRNVYLRAKNVEMGTLAVNLFSPGSQEDYRMKYFKLNGNNITERVTEPFGFVFNVQGGKAKKFRMQIKAKDGTASECIYPNAIFDGGDDTAVVDVNLPMNVACVL